MKLNGHKRLSIDRVTVEAMVVGLENKGSCALGIVRLPFEQNRGANIDNPW
jgi:hypothetical protein